MDLVEEKCFIDCMNNMMYGGGGSALNKPQVVATPEECLELCNL